MTDEIEAARIAASATLQAARVQGEWTFGAGLVALFGGGLAIAGAILGARRQVRLEERKHKARVTAYKFRVQTVAKELEERARFISATACLRIKRSREGKSSDSLEIYPLRLPPDFFEKNWEDHALLGADVVEAIHQVRTKIQSYTDFQHEASGGNNGEGGRSVHRDFKRDGMVEHPDGSISFEYNTVEEEYQIRSQELLAAVSQLKASLKGGPIGT